MTALPVTLAAYIQDQLKERDLLFPAERSYYDRFFALLDRSAPETVEQLFRPLRDLERAMGVNEKTFPKSQFSLEQVDFLNRNPRYPEWRSAVAQVFSRVDPALDAEVARSGHARLVVVIAPAQLPADPGRMWTRIQSRGRRIPIDPPDRAEDYVPQLLTGGGPATLGQLFARGKHGGPYGSWTIEAGAALSKLGAPEPPTIQYSYEALDAYRKRLMREVQKIVEAQEVPGPRQLSARLKQLKILASEGDLARDPILAEFARAILLSGNGTLLINNTFVEWATMQAVRRARPSVTVIGFGIRNKVKPFSSLLIYADQEATNPIPSQMDTLGSWVDLEVFYQYIWQEFEKYAEYRTNTAYLFVADGADEMLAIAPADFPLHTATGPQTPAKVFAHAKEWLGV